MMPAPRWTREDYDRAADEYQRNLPPEHYMEASLAGVQRAITLASLMVVRGLMGGLHVFNELLVQFFSRGRLVQVVPDNMVVRGELEDRPRKSYAADEEPVPFWVLEYVSRGSERKDYVENRRIYEQDLKVPYYLIFDPERKDLVLLHRVGRRYLAVEVNPAGRLEIDELEMEVGLVEGWVRFWFRGELIALPDELHRQLGVERRGRVIAERALQRREREIEQMAEEIQNREALIHQRDEQLHQRDEQLHQRDEQLHQRDEQLHQRDAVLSAVLASLRPLVEAKARSAGRDDVLAALPAADPVQLSAWLTELG